MARAAPPAGRPLTGRRALVLLLGLLVLAGCGDHESPPQASRYHGCRIADFASTGHPVGTARLGREKVPLRRVGPRDSRCPDSLIGRFLVGVQGVDLSRLDASTITVVPLRGVDRDVVAVDGPARFGTRTHLFGDSLDELVSGDQPLLPVNPTGRRVPVDATCAPRGRIAVTTARPHEPPGIVLAWDVTRTTYDVSKEVARPVRSTTVRRAVADPTLRASHPELYDGKLLANCR